MMRSFKLCAVDKAPGPNGFTMEFFIKYWEAVKQDIMKAFQIIYDNEMFGKSFNATFIALIPKKKGANELRDFRPISLIGLHIQYILPSYNREVERCDDKASWLTTNGLHPIRQIMDVVLVANEVVGSGLKQKKQGILRKLNLEKTI